MATGEMMENPIGQVPHKVRKRYAFMVSFESDNFEGDMRLALQDVQKTLQIITLQIGTLREVRVGNIIEVPKKSLIIPGQ